jgi:hypothetical protein
LAPGSRYEVDVSALDSEAPLRHSSAPYDLALVEALLASYAAALSEPLVPPGLSAVDAAAWLYEQAEVAVLAHDTADDPCFVYANRAAQRCFERPWGELVGMPSRLSAEAPERGARAAMLEQVARYGFLRGYRGLRVAGSGRRFWIEDGIIWNVRRADGALCGQAACFRPPDAAAHPRVTPKPRQ